MVFNFKFQSTKNAKCSSNGFKHKFKYVCHPFIMFFVYPCAKPLKSWKSKSVPCQKSLFVLLESSRHAIILMNFISVYQKMKMPSCFINFFIGKYINDIDMTNEKWYHINIALSCFFMQYMKIYHYNFVLFLLKSCH